MSRSFANSNMTVWVDNREPKWMLRSFRKIHPSDQVIYRQCHLGDVIAGRIGIERKEVVDAVGSVADGSLLDQCNRMGVQCDEQDMIAFLCIHGDLELGIKTWREHTGGAISVEEVIHEIGMATRPNDISYMWLPTARLAVVAMYETLMMQDKLYNRKLNRLKRGWKDLCGDTKTWYLASALRIEPMILKPMLDSLGGIVGLREASMRKLCSFPSVGRVTAERIKQML